MKPLTRDISVTLIIKLTLLFVLWFVCFKGGHKPMQNASDWLLGAHASSHAVHVDDI